jgi:hypothetical protein
MIVTTKPAVDSALMMKVRQLDLSQVRNYLIVRKGWSHARAVNAIEGYYQFLYLSGTRFKVRPPQDIDEVWHRHILHTEQYQRDCMSLFGRFIHHRPFPVEVPAGADCENDCESKAADCENDCESRVELKADCENDCESRATDCESDCESGMKVFDLTAECESEEDDDDYGGGDGDLGEDEDLEVGEGDEDDEDYRASSRSHSFTELSHTIFGKKWKPVLN